MINHFGDQKAAKSKQKQEHHHNIWHSMWKTPDKHNKAPIGKGDEAENEGKIEFPMKIARHGRLNAAYVIDKRHK